MSSIKFVELKARRKLKMSSLCEQVIYASNKPQSKSSLILFDNNLTMYTFDAETRTKKQVAENSFESFKLNVLFDEVDVLVIEIVLLVFFCQPNKKQRMF